MNTAIATSIQEQMLQKIRDISAAYTEKGLFTLGELIFSANELIPLQSTQTRVEAELQKLCDAFTGSQIAMGAAVFEANDYLYDIDRNIISLTE